MNPEREIPVTEYRKGDKIRVVDVLEGIVTDVREDAIDVDNQQCVHFDVSQKWIRTIEIIDPAPAPWQAGDILDVSGSLVVRQADGVWVNRYGDTLGLKDEHVENNGAVIAVVRGGKRV